MRTIWFDMDGTIADLYGVTDWLSKLRSYDESPYDEAKPMLNFSLLARYLNQLRTRGYKIGIISWLAKDSTATYDLVVEISKRDWLQNHLPSVYWDDIHITNFGLSKNTWMRETDDILFDDNEAIRNEWIGDAYPPDQILSVLKELLRKE